MNPSIDTILCLADTFVTDDDDRFNFRTAVESFRPLSHSFTLLVFRDHHQARLSGFKRNLIHPLDRELMAWWPGLAESNLYGRVFPKIIIGSDVRLSGHQEEVLRSRQMTFQHRIWIEL